MISVKAMCIKCVKARLTKRRRTVSHKIKTSNNTGTAVVIGELQGRAGIVLYTIL